METRKLTSREKESHRAKRLMSRLIASFRARLDEQLKSHNVTTAQVKLLHEVRERPGGSGAQLARACYVTPQSAQAMLARAVARGWVVRGKDAENERLVTARLTPEGHRLLKLAEAIVQTIEAEVWRGTSAAELMALNTTLERGLAHLEVESG